MAIKQLGELLEKEQKFTLLQIGHTGHGKTTRALDATRFGKVLVFDFDGKVDATASKLSEAQQELIEVATQSTFMEAWEDLLAVAQLFEEGKAPYATLIVDTYTKLNKLAYDLALGKQADQLNVSTDFKTFGNIGRACDMFINKLLSLPCNVIINAHTGDDPTTKPIEGLGKQGKTIPYWAKHTQYLYFGAGKFNVKAKRSDTFPANSPLPDAEIDALGCVKKPGLECFEYCAFRSK